jgi:hypothetical protein
MPYWSDALSSVSQGTQQHRAQNRSDGRRALLAREPLPDAYRIQPIAHARQLPDRGNRAKSLGERKIAQPQERRQQMERRGKAGRCAKVVASALGPAEMEHAFPTERAAQAGAAAEVGKVRAARHTDMLAEVDHLA